MDRFSQLTSALQSTILSLLSFKDVARASLVSKSWCHICYSQSIKDMEFNEELFIRSNHATKTKADQRMYFMMFAKTWIKNYQATKVEKLSLSLSEPIPFLADLISFIEFAITKKVESFALDFSDPEWNNGRKGERCVSMPQLPLQVFNYPNLESLKLFACKITVDHLVPFNFLKSLSLAWIELKDFVLEPLLSNCSSLENLSLKKCWKMDSRKISVCGLRTLTLEKCYFDPDPLYIEVIAPELQCFHYSGDFRTIDIVHIDNMEEMYLDFGLERVFNHYGDYLYDLLFELRGIRALTIDSYVLQVLPFGFAATFDPPLQLRHLTWRTAMHHNEFFGYSIFLKSCPHLETLFIDINRMRMLEDYEAPEEIIGDYWDGGECTISVPCLERSLKVVEVKGFKGTGNEIQFLTYIIKFGRVMQTIMLKSQSDGNSNVYSERAKLLGRANVPRASAELRILFVRD